MDLKRIQAAAAGFGLLTIALGFGAFLVLEGSHKSATAATVATATPGRAEVAMGIEAGHESQNVPSARPEGAGFEPRPEPNPLRNAYFGDLHVHTKISVDSFLRGNMLTMADAYRFAQGAQVTTSAGQKIQLKHPLDFVALTDHSESFATYDLCLEGIGSPSQTPGCLDVKHPVGDQLMAQAAMKLLAHARSKANCGGPVEKCYEAEKRVWQYIQKLAAKNYHPGKFTDFIAYEYSAGVRAYGTRGHMHRNVIFANTHVPGKPFSALDGPRNYMLWKWLSQNCTGPCDVIAIPHNTNLSMGYQFALETVDGTKYNFDDWKRRAQYERLVEIFQIKGNSECNVGFGTTDEECNFEQIVKEKCGTDSHGICIAKGSFVRNALKTGLALKDELGFNPFKLGFIGSTDTHSAVPGGTVEATYPGSIGRADGTPQKRLASPFLLGRNPGGLAGVWAEEDTRPSIFAALKRRETFATSGTRIRVRFFGGWHLPANLDKQANWIADGYTLGVPMGADLPKRRNARAPTFVVWAARDPDSAKLAKIQVVKGWHADKGDGEAIYDVACSDGNVPDAQTHRCPDNGATVNITDCSTSGDKGASTLSATWTDPDFDPKTPAFYYVRVFENPTCRWSTYDAIRLHQPPPPLEPTTIRERAWSSPIWYDFRPDRLSGL